MSDVLVLCYHAVSPDWDATLSVTPRDLEAQVGWLLRRGYVPTTLTQAVEAPPAPHTLAITFDDGFQSVRDLAFPILERLGVVATLYVPSTLIADEPRSLVWPGVDHWMTTPHAHELTGMTWDTVRELQDAGWEIGSHTCTHPRLTTLDDAHLEAELVRSRAEVERQTGRTCTSIAYPYGDVDRRVAEASGRAGYRVGATLPNRFPAHPEPLLWPRVGVYTATSDAAFRRRVSPLTRRLMATELWGPVTVVLPAVRRVQGIARALVLGGHASPTRAIRFVARRGRVAQRRPAVLAAGLAARAGALDAHTVWPDASRPAFMVGAGHRQAARWMSRTFEPEARRAARLAPATWNVLRARALVVPRAQGLAVAAAEHALNRPLRRPRVATFSPSGAPLTKTTCFVFEGAAADPTVVVKGMGDATQQHRLRSEVEVVERLRARLGKDPIAGALPLKPLYAGDLGGEYVVVQGLDPLAQWTGRGGPEPAMRWLRGFHERTTDELAPVGAADVEEAVRTVARAWSFARPQRADAVAERVQALLGEVAPEPLPRCFAHGDYWAGNMAVDGSRVRVYDWEWTAPSRLPAFDVWTYQLAELRHLAFGGETDATLLGAGAEALAAVEREFAERRIDPRLALATLAPSLAELSFRFRVETGRPGGNEAGAVRLLTIVERIIGIG